MTDACRPSTPAPPGLDTPETAAFLARHAPAFATFPGSFAGLADHFDLVQSSPLAIDPAGLVRLERDGFAILPDRRYATPLLAYRDIYRRDLPVYVTADSILHAMHASAGALLEDVEEEELVPGLERLLRGLRQRLAAGAGGSFGPEARADVDLVAAVALELLAGTEARPVAGAKPAAIAELAQGAIRAVGPVTVELFGVPRTIDFAGFRPRGRYDGSEELGRYFRAMKWLGNAAFRLVETRADGSQALRRRQLAAALAMREALDRKGLAELRRLDAILGVFVGRSDAMTADELDAALAPLGPRSGAVLARLPDPQLEDALQSRGRAERIAGRLVSRAPGAGTLPPSIAVALLGPRDVPDAHALSELVHDRVGGGEIRRLRADPLDVAFTVFGNDAAAPLLRDELNRFPYGPDLEAQRNALDERPPAFWDESLYHRQLFALRELAAEGAERSLVPPVMRTEAWSRRLLQTQLASWAELRHDFVLYVEPVHVGHGLCEYPDAYVDPYPRFFDAVAAYARKGRELLRLLPAGSPLRRAPPARTVNGKRVIRMWPHPTADDYFERLESAAVLLAEMARRERAGLPFTPEQLAFVNQAVAIQSRGCMPSLPVGWFAGLYYDLDEGTQYFAPTVADVLVQPEDGEGNPVGCVLHVVTGAPRLMAVLVESCGVERLYLGPVSAYHEIPTGNFQRVTRKNLSWEEPPPEVPWFSDLTAP